MISVDPEPIDNLLLDPDNPRLPESLQGSPQSELLAHLFENDVLDELASSFLANGYFENEPLLVLPPNEDGHRIVVEGNRRLAALVVLLQSEAAVEAELEFDLSGEPDIAGIEELRHVPCYEVASRAEVSAYLGYRHIGGLRQWPAEAKARYIASEVRRAQQGGVGDPFYYVGRVLGSNARGVRTAYENLAILRFAHQEAGYDTTPVSRDRFTVWGLLIAKDPVRHFINYVGRPKTLAAVDQAISEIDEDRLVFVLDDLTPRRAGMKPVLADSRAVTIYAEVLADERATEVLEQYHDLTLASSVLKQSDMLSRLAEVARRLETILVDARTLQVDTETVAMAETVRELSESIESVIQRKASR